MVAKLRFGPPKHRNFLIHAMHQLSVPEKSKHEDETKRRNECDEEFFPVHNLFRLRFLLSPIEPERLHRKTFADVDPKLSPGDQERRLRSRHFLRLQPELARKSNVHIGRWVFRGEKFVAIKNRIRACEKTECLTLTRKPGAPGCQANSRLRLERQKPNW